MSSHINREAVNSPDPRIMFSSASDMRNVFQVNVKGKLGPSFIPSSAFSSVLSEKDDVGKRLGEQVQMDDCPIVLGMEFLDSVNAVPIPCANTLAILGEKNGPCLVPLAREGSVKATQI
nr:WPP domain-associated protein [Ipomoea batatas]GME01074.1 WPP domain-associated protein [Ipomoea batatas]GME17715.1 WPP domain-associated protein [Ipomoea batatas]